MEKHFRSITSRHCDQGGRTVRVSTPEIWKEHVPRYKRMSNPVSGCPQSPRSVGSALRSMPRCRHTASRFQCLNSFQKLNLISVTVITVSFDISNTFLNLVKDLNQSELVPQVSQYWTILSSYSTLHSLEVSQEIATVPMVH